MSKGMPLLRDNRDNFEFIPQVHLVTRRGDVKMQVFLDDF